jgi:hypothetical protein
MDQQTQILIQTAYRRLQSLQKYDGSFRALNLKTKKETDALFPTIYCGHIIGKLKDLDHRSVPKKVREYVLGHMSERSTWNYWGNPAHADAGKKYPDDMDDTSLAISLLIEDSPHENRIWRTVQHMDPRQDIEIRPLA